MFSQLFAVAAVAAVASALPTGGAPPASQCNVGYVSMRLLPTVPSLTSCQQLRQLLQLPPEC
jgi:hypothetical protein